MACLLGYGEVGLWLQKESQKENSWVVRIDDYPGDIAFRFSILFSAWLTIYLSDQKEVVRLSTPSPGKLAEWVGVWVMGLDIL